MPRDGWERFVRTFTPVHYYLCRDCGHRGIHLGPVPLPINEGGPHTGRPIEERDRQAALAKYRSTVFSVLLAIVLGAAAGFYIHSCRQGQESSRPAE